DWNADQAETMCDVNFTGCARVMGAALPAMVARGAGHVVITGSLSGCRGAPRPSSGGFGMMRITWRSISPRGAHRNTAPGPTGSGRTRKGPARPAQRPSGSRPDKRQAATGPAVTSARRSGNRPSRAETATGGTAMKRPLES
ncbi:MAG: SDR family NAD(P)-dependent oxidoreductase, partial [Cereibacter sp.]